MNSSTLVVLGVAMLIEYVAGIVVDRQQRGSPLTRMLWILSMVLFITAVSLTDYLAPLRWWIKLPIAVVVGLVLANLWLPVSFVLGAPWRTHRR